MKKLFLFYFFFTLTSTLFSQNPKSDADHFFYENKGQMVDQKGKANSDVKYLFQSNGLNVQLKNKGFAYDVYEVKKTLKKKKKVKNDYISPKNKNLQEYDLNFQYHRVDIDFINGNKNPQIIAEGKSTDYDNYYNVPGKPEGITNVHRFKKITYKNLYPNIDLVFFKPNDTLKPVEYNFVVNPGGKISDIQLKFNGAKTKLKDGKLSMNLRFGEMHENIPESWTEEQHRKMAIDVSFKDLGNQTFGFYSQQNVSDKVVVIDPVPMRIWATYYWGNSYDDKVKNIRTDDDGNVYISTQISIPETPNLTTSGAFQTNIGSIYDEYSLLSKFDSDGRRLWSTFIGNFSFYSNGGFMNVINDFELDQSNNIYIVGKANEQKNGYSNNITTPGSHKVAATGFGVEGMIMKFNDAGQRLWGTYFGGDDGDEILSVSLDSEENLIISGRTYSNTGIATANPYAPYFNYNYWIGFFGKFSKDGVQLYGSYLPEIIYKNTVDKNDNYIFSAYSYDASFPNQATPGTHQPNIIGGANSLILKFDKNFNKLWGTYYGGTLLYPQDGQNVKNNFVYGLGTDSAGNIFIAGNTTATQNIATPGAHKPQFGGTDSDVFIAKLDQDGKRSWGTYYGANTSFEDVVFDMFVKEDGSLFIVGGSRNDTGLVTPNGYISNYNGSYTHRSGYISKFSSSGSQIWGTYYPESFSVFHRNNYVYTYGRGIPDFGTPGTFMGTNPYWGSYLISKFRDCQNNVAITANSNVCPGSEIKLLATGGTSYFWTGPNQFTSVLPNPIISNASSINSGTYTCVISGTGDCDGTYSVTIKVEDSTAPIPKLAILPTITGNCQTIVTAIPTATDACVGNIIGTTTDPLQYSLPGNYVIRWTFKDGNGNSSSQNQNVIITSESLPMANSPQDFCLIDNPKISSIIITGTGIKWYDTAGNSLNPNTVLVDGTSYFATQTLNGCESAPKEILVKINNASPPTGNENQEFCSAQNPTISNIVVTETNVKWYDTAGNSLAITTPLIDGQTYHATQTIAGCEGTQKLAVKVKVTNGGIPANDYSIAFCNDTISSTKSVNLRNYKANLIADLNNYSFEFFDQNNQEILNPSAVNLNIGSNVFNVKISNSLGCYKFVQLTLTLNPKPILNLGKEVEFCNGKAATLDAGVGFSYYEWTKDSSPTVISNDQILIVSEPGIYAIKVKNSFGCENSASVNVTQSVIATIVGVTILNNSATVEMSAPGDFEYSLDNSKWQDSKVFKNLLNKNYTVDVRTKLGCIIGSFKFTIFNISNVFTPNGDGTNDTWKIIGLENYPNSQIQVFDRFGKLVLDKITNGSFEWDGTFNSQILPTGNYWYVIKVSDGRLLNGWLLLKNRN